MASPVIYEPRGRAREYAALACNLYSGCTHGCRYCYAPACLHQSREEFHSNGVPRPGILERLEAEAPRYAESTEPVLLCFTCDPYQPSEGEYRVTRRALEILNRHDVPWTVLTKGGRLAVARLQARGYLVVYGDKIALTIRGLVRAHREWRQPTIPDSEHPLRLRAIAAELHARAIAPGNDGGGPGEWRIDTEAGMLLEVADELERLREELSR